MPFVSLRRRRDTQSTFPDSIGMVPSSNQYHCVSPFSNCWRATVIRALLLPFGFANDAFRDPAGRAAAATVGARKGIAYLTNTCALRAYNFPAPKACQECGFVNAVGHEAGDPLQPLTCPDSFLWQSPSFGYVGNLLAYRPETAVPSASLAYLQGFFGTADAKKVL